MSMIMTRAMFARMLEEELTRGYDVVRIARRAYELHLDSRDLEPGLEAEILKVVAMEEGPEFELSETELSSLVRSLREGA